jgi:hypothetical protein
VSCYNLLYRNIANGGFCHVVHSVAKGRVRKCVATQNPNIKPTFWLLGLRRQYTDNPFFFLLHFLHFISSFDLSLSLFFSPLFDSINPLSLFHFLFFKFFLSFLVSILGHNFHSSLAFIFLRFFPYQSLSLLSSLCYLSLLYIFVLYSFLFSLLSCVLFSL